MNRHAFTLVETLIVVLIVGIMAGLALPMMAQTDSSRLRAAADLLVADLAYAQIESIAHSEDPRVMVFDTTDHGYHIAAASDTATPINNPVGNVPYEVVFGQGRAVELSGVTIDTLDVGDDDQLQFGIYGQLDQAAAATITLAVGSKLLDLSVDPINGDVTVGAIYSE